MCAACWVVIHHTHKGGSVLRGERRTACTPTPTTHRVKKNDFCNISTIKDKEEKASKATQGNTKKKEALHRRAHALQHDTGCALRLHRSGPSHRSHAFEAALSWPQPKCDRRPLPLRFDSIRFRSTNERPHSLAHPVPASVAVAPTAVESRSRPPTRSTAADAR